MKTALTELARLPNVMFWCHFDDDNYVALPQLAATLRGIQEHAQRLHQVLLFICSNLQTRALIL